MILEQIVTYLNPYHTTYNKINFREIKELNIKKWYHKILTIKYRLLFLAQCEDGISKHKNNW